MQMDVFRELSQIAVRETLLVDMIHDVLCRDACFIVKLLYDAVRSDGLQNVTYKKFPQRGATAFIAKDKT